MKKSLSKAVTLVTAFFCLSSAAMAEKQEVTVPDIEVVPFAFSTEQMGFSAGLAGLWKGAGQPQASLFAAGLGSSTGTWLSFIAANNYALAADSRWLFGGQFYEADYKQFDYYLGNAASNDSAFDDRIKLDSREAQHHLSFRYILPLGAAESSPIRAALTPKRPVDGNAPWNSGVSSIDFRPFYKAQHLTGDGADKVSEFSDASEVWGLETRFKWDNRDSTTNPTKGSVSEFILTVDPGSDNRASWWKWEASQSWYWSLGDWEEMAKEQVFAFNIYTADTPSWNETSNINGQTAYNRPPEFASVRLGGLYRLRSFQTGRYADRSALSYSMEYRVIPEWQPLGDVPVFNWYDVPWWQWVLFADVGRVADDFNLETLHENMKWSAGVAMRFQVEGIVVRSEMALGSEEGLFRVMINQPF
ncbi:BamA/TamA family outer membrane protein [Enterovibrio sp. ZSDZ35]|uniref:BamA/TamA family outer membrane protein n=1 Tax=Enterovibrio qingdaonensis TaxID=2899818 RepID=A0ABT5QMP0_9GAMM|nr:BamA/TamA family outer membrane protein [Enterovibrio sp. ZSDZ35]MDD1781546.1 BamA/TamA family outer membrane protein [Enterovibrio sp. ZSDZ35]